MDKIGIEGVSKELTESGFSEDSAARYCELFRGLDAASAAAGETAGARARAEAELSYLEEKLEGVIEPDVIPNLREIMNTVEKSKKADFEVVFDATIVRGMSYYTGTIFEIAMPELGISCGGGGRYDRMVGRFTGTDVPACGFSIGFERIILILMEQGFTIPGKPEKICFLLDKNLSRERLSEAIAKAQAEREQGKQVLVVRMNKNKKFQKEQLTAQGYTEFQEFYAEALK
jgi:histidyl-tRNA synthetase